jgi:hypothetical protein
MLAPGTAGKSPGLLKSLTRSGRAGLEAEAASLIGNHADVIIDAVERRYIGIVEAVIMNQLGAPTLDRLEVGIYAFSAVERVSLGRICLSSRHNEDLQEPTARCEIPSSDYTNAWGWCRKRSE